jgi:histidyl-tRNA synthetase
MGLERLVLMLQTLELDKDLAAPVDIYVTALDESVELYAWQITEHIRDALPQIRLMNHCGGGNVKKQMKKADASGAKLALLIGGGEMQEQTITIKFLREQQEQVSVARAEIIHFIQQSF